MPPLALLADIAACMAFLTRAPVTTAGLDGDRGLARSAWAFPVVGALVGGLGAVVYAIAASMLEESRFVDLRSDLKYTQD